MLYALLTVRFSVHTLSSVSCLPLIKYTYDIGCWLLKPLELSFISRSLLTLPKEVAACFHWFWGKVAQNATFFFFHVLHCHHGRKRGSVFSLLCPGSIQQRFPKIRLFLSWSNRLAAVWGKIIYCIEYFPIWHHLSQKGSNKGSGFPPCTSGRSELLKVRENCSEKAIK